MKKLICIILILVMCQPVLALAEDSYITLEMYPYSSHVLGDDLIIYGDTDFSTVVLGFCYPDDEQGYKGYAKFVITISGDELRRGYVIPTETHSRLWPEGEWKVIVQHGDIRSEIKIPMTKAPSYNRCVRLAHYNDNTLTDMETYITRGIDISDNVISFSLDDSTTVRIFSWDSLSPTDSGETRLIIAFFNDGYMTSAKTYTGFLTDYGNHISLEISENERLELLFWNDNLMPY